MRMHVLVHVYVSLKLNLMCVMMCRTPPQEVALGGLIPTVNPINPNL